MALLCAAQAVSAQNENPVAESESGFSLSKVTIRPTIGVNIAYETFDGGETGILTSFKVGAIADYAIDHTWGLRTGLLLSGQGGESYHDIGTGTFLAHSLSTRDNPWYLEIPLNAYVDVFTWQNVSFKAFVGFPIEIGLFGKYKLQGEKNPSGVTAGGYEHGCFDKDGLNRFAIAFNGGIEATWRKFTLGIEYNRHLTNDAQYGDSYHLQYYSVYLGYNFKL